MASFGLMILLRNLSENTMFNSMKSERYWLTDLVFDLLKKDIVQERMFMQQWGKRIVVVTSLYSLFIKQTNVP